VFNLCCFFLNEKTEKVAVVVHLSQSGNDLESDDEDMLNQPKVKFGYAVV
jgi:hypothetical protein